MRQIDDSMLLEIQTKVSMAGEDMSLTYRSNRPFYNLKPVSRCPENFQSQKSFVCIVRPKMAKIKIKNAWHKTHKEFRKKENKVNAESKADNSMSLVERNFLLGGSHG